MECWRNFIQMINHMIMKKLLLFLFTLFSIEVFGQTPAMEMLIFPRFTEGTGSNLRHHGIPYVYRAKITGLKPGLTYRYINQTTEDPTPNSYTAYLSVFPPANVPPGTIDYTAGDFYRPPVNPGAPDKNDDDGTLLTNYGQLTAGSDGTYTGWFIMQTVLTPGSTRYLSLSLNNPEATTEDELSKVANIIFSPADQPITALTLNSLENIPGEQPLYGSAIRSTAATSGQAKNFVFLYDNIEGTGRPISGTYIESDGTSGDRSTLNGLGAFYFDHVDGQPQRWGSMVMNSDAKGIRRIEQRKLEDGTVAGYNTSADGSWADGENPGSTVSTVMTTVGANRNGLVAIVLDGSLVTLGAVKTPQTVAFTNTFPTTFKVGDPDFTLSASSSANLNNFQYTVAPAGILEITGSTVKIIGGGTAVITVTEPGNASTDAGTATKSITVDANPQVITGLPATLSTTYGEPNLELTATGGASTNPVIYTSDDPATAEITEGNTVIIKKGGTVVIRANQLGNANYSPAPEVISTLTIAKASLDVIAENKSKVQGAVNPEATFIYGPFKGTDNASAVTGTPILDIAAEASSPAGEYAINIDVSGLTSDKYTFNPIAGKLIVEAKQEQVITFTNFPASATYGNQPLSFQVTTNSANEVTFTTSNPAVAIAERNEIGEWTVRVVGAGEADLIAAQAEDATYGPGAATAHISIAKAPLSVIAEDKSKLTGAADPVFTARYEGFVNNDDMTRLSGELVFTTQPDGTDFIIVPSGLTSDNYALTFVNGRLTQGSIAFAPMNKIYGDAAFDPGAISTGGTPVYTVANPAIAVINPAGLLEIKGAGTTNVTATFTAGGSATVTLRVEQKEVTIRPDAKTRVYAQENPILTATYTGFAYAETESVLTTPPQITTTAAVTSAAANYAINASGAVAANYKFIYQPGVLTVTKAALTVKADDRSKVYGQANPELTVSGTEGLAPQDVVASLGLRTVVTTTATTGSPVNTYPITVTGLPSVTNYTVTYLPGVLTVTPEALTIAAVDAERAQGAPNPVFTFAFKGFVNEDNAESLTTGPVASTTATASSARGTYPITVSGASSPNYTISYQPGQLFIKGLQTIVYQDLPAVSYGDADFTPVVSSNTGGQPVFSSDNPNVAVIEGGRVKIIAAGTVNIIASFPATNDFVAYSAAKSLVIAKRTLLVRVDSKTRLYGQANPVLTATYDGFAKGETIAAVSAPALLSTNATTLSAVGTYAIIGNGASALNYIFTYEPGILTVDKAVLTVTADNKTRIFGVENPAFTFRYTGFVNAESQLVIENPAIASTTAVTDSPAGTYPINLSGATDENYTFNYVSGVLTITSTSRTIAMDPIPVKFVGDADFTPAIVLSSGETPVLTSADASIATIVDNKIHLVGSGNVTITASAPVNSSYTSTPTVSRLLVVNKVTQTITFDAVPVLKPDGIGYTLKAVSTSGLPVTFTVSSPLYASLEGNVLKGLRVGRIQVSATQPGNNQFAAANIIVQDVQITDASGEAIRIHPALSVNGDGINEYLTIDGIKEFPLNKVTIINRGGIKVFDVEGYDNDAHVFAGKSKAGLVLPQGTYFCLIEYNVDSKLKRKTGYFILKY